MFVQASPTAARQAVKPSLQPVHAPPPEKEAKLLPPRFYQYHQNPVLQDYRERAGHLKHLTSYLDRCMEHTLNRLKERYNTSVTAQDWERLNWAIFRETSDTKRLFVKSHDTTLYQVRYVPFHQGRTRTFFVMFSEAAYCISTAVPQSDIRLQSAEKGEMKDIAHTFSPLMKQRYEFLTRFQQSHGRNPFRARAEADA